MYARIIDMAGVQTVAEVVDFDPSELFTPEVAALFQPAAPGMTPGARFVEGVWVPLPEPVPVPPVTGPMPVEIRRQMMTATINAERDRRIDAPFVFNGVALQADAVSRGRIDRARISALAAIVAGAQPGNLRWHGEPVDFIWIAADDSRMPMDAQTVVQFGSGLAAREGLLVVHANDLKQLVAAAEGDAALDAIDIMAGWPA
jgi:hypothetical protein